MYLQHTSRIERAFASFDKVPWSTLEGSETKTLRDYTRALYNRLELKYSKFHKMDDFCRLGFLAAEKLLAESEPTVNFDKLGIFLINRYSSLNTDQSFHASYSADNQSIPSPSMFVYTLPNILIGEISIRHKITGEHMFFVQREFGSEFIYLYVQTLFETGAIDGAVIGYCEVTPETFGSQMGFVTQQPESNFTSQLFDQTYFEEWINK